MEELVNLIATDSSASDVSDQIKDILYTKATDKIEKLLVRDFTDDELKEYEKTFL